MDKLFTEDRNGSLDILAIICAHLSSYRDLLALEQVSDLTCTSVRAHQHPHKVTLGWPGFGMTTKQEDEGEDMDTDDDAIDRSQDGDDEECGGNETITPRGPIIQWLCVTIKLEERVMAALALDWLFKTLTQNAAHLKRLEIGFESFPESTNGQDFVALNSFARTALPKLSFPQCTWLTVNFYHVRSPNDASILLPTLLSHFPALETLRLKGGCLPLLKHLVAPEKLKKLSLEPTCEGFQTLSKDEMVVILPLGFL